MTSEKNKSITMMRGKSTPPGHNSIHFIENCKYNQLCVSLKEYLERNITKHNNEGNFPQKRIFILTFSMILQPSFCIANTCKKQQNYTFTKNNVTHFFPKQIIIKEISLKTGFFHFFQNFTQKGQ